MIFNFGKYKGQDVFKVAQTEEGRKYCKWLVEQDICPENVYNYLVYWYEIGGK